MKLFKKLFTNNYELQKVQDNISEVLTDFSLIPIVRGIFLDADLGTYDTTIEHKLGRKYLGFLVVGLSSNAVVFNSSTVNSSPERQIILRADSSTTAKLYIF